MADTSVLPSENKENSQPNLETSSSKQTQKGESSGRQHNLKHPWTLWYDAQLSGGKRPSQWGENMKEVYSFSTVEDFWRMHNNLALASQIQQGCSFSLFKKGIEPKWEDPKNAKGGKWTLLVNKGKGQIDTIWLWTMLACIGEVLEEDGGEHIAGAIVNIRKGQDKINLWTIDASEDEVSLRIGHRLKKALELPDDQKLQFGPHFTQEKGPKFEI